MALSGEKEGEELKTFASEEIDEEKRKIIHGFQSLIRGIKRAREDLLLLFAAADSKGKTRERKRNIFMIFLLHLRVCVFARDDA